MITIVYAFADSPYADESDINWYRCREAACIEPIEVAASRSGNPLRRYTLSIGDVGYYLMAEVAHRHERCEAGEKVRSITTFSLSSELVTDRTIDMESDMSPRSVANQPEVVPGVWTYRNWASPT